MKYLLVVAHPDDEVLGAGASMFRWSREGHQIDVAIMCTEAKARAFRPEDKELDEDLNASSDFLGIHRKFEATFPNNDHLQTSMACQEAVRLFQRRPEVKRVQELWYMEVPSCTEWKINSAMVSFNPNCYVEVGKEGVDAKVKALSMYRGVMRPYPHPRSAEFIEGLAAYRGGQWGLMYAEAFEVVMRAY